MDAYIHYVIIMLLALANCLIKKQYQRKSSLILLLLMMFMCGFRGYDVGKDTPNYTGFISAPSDYVYDWGPIYFLFRFISNLLPYPETVFLLLMAMATYIPLMYLTKRYSMKPALTVLMYIIPTAIYFNETFNIARQSIAIIYILWAAIMLGKKKMMECYALTVLAFFFHTYSIFYVFFFIVYKFRFTPKFVYISILVTVILGLIGTIAGIHMAINTVAALASNASGSFVQNLGFYTQYDIESNFSLIGQLSHILPLAALCILGANKRVQNYILFKMMVCGCLLMNLFTSVAFCERLASTFTIAQILAVPVIYSYSSKKRKKLIMILLIMTAALYVYELKGYSTNKELWIPYHTFLTNVI